MQRDSGPVWIHSYQFRIVIIQRLVDSEAAVTTCTMRCAVKLQHQANHHSLTGLPASIGIGPRREPDDTVGVTK